MREETFISIHAPRVRCDGWLKSNDGTEESFQSTHLVWGATYLISSCFSVIHHFNPRTSCEVRRLFLEISMVGSIFQSTHLVWGATWTAICWFYSPYISIHAPRVRCDTAWTVSLHALQYFNPRTSCEVRPMTATRIIPPIIFQSTHLVWGATLYRQDFSPETVISIHAPRVRCDGYQMSI